MKWRRCGNGAVRRSVAASQQGVAQRRIYSIATRAGTSGPGYNAGTHESARSQGVA